jgi:hypothetical protein
MSSNWKTTAELMVTLTAWRRAVHNVIRENQSHGPAEIAEHVAHIYSWSGTDDATANAKAAKVLKIGSQVMEHLHQIDTLIGAAKAEVKAAADFMDEQEAKRRSQAAKYKV